MFLYDNFSFCSFSRNFESYYRDLVQRKLWEVKKWEEPFPKTPVGILHCSVVSVLVSHFTKYHLLTLTISKEEYQKNYLGKNIINHPLIRFSKQERRGVEIPENSPIKTDSLIFETAEEFWKNLQDFPKINKTLIIQAIRICPFYFWFKKRINIELQKYSDDDLEAIINLIEISIRMLESLCPLKELRFDHFNISERSKRIQIVGGSPDFAGNGAILKLRMSSRYSLKKSIPAPSFLQMLLYSLYIEGSPIFQKLVFVDPLNREFCYIDLDKLGGREYLRQEIEDRFFDLTTQWLKQSSE